MFLIGVLENAEGHIGTLLAGHLARRSSSGSLLIKNGRPSFLGKQASFVIFSSPSAVFFGGLPWDLLLLSDPLSGNNTVSARMTVTDSGAPFPSLISDQIISCGPNSRDTLTFSSLSETRGVLSVQRRIDCLNGSTIDPGELEVPLCDGALRETMLLSGALLGLGVAPFSP